MLRAMSDVPRPLHEAGARANARTADVSRRRAVFRVSLHASFGLMAVALTVVIVLRLTAGGHSRKAEVSTTVALRPAVADFALFGNGGLIWPHCGGLNWPHLRPTRC
jgi:hypothetical protein